MENFHVPLSLFLLLPLLVSSTQRQVYIVYFGEHSGEKTFQEIEESHHSYLFSVKESDEDAKSSLFYSYKNSINGFAALLTPIEASKLSEKEEVVSVIESQPTKYRMHTTRSWEFAGLQDARKWNTLQKQNLLIKSNYGKDVIVGMLDNGVWPESKSFSDKGMGPIPKSWRGVCQSGDGFNSSHCNNLKIQRLVRETFVEEKTTHHSTTNYYLQHLVLQVNNGFAKLVRGYINGKTLGKPLRRLILVPRRDQWLQKRVVKNGNP